MAKRTFLDCAESQPAVAEDLMRASLSVQRERRVKRLHSGQASLLPRESAMWLRRLFQLPILLGLFGGALLAGGAGAPLIHIPIVGSLSYLRHPAYFTACSIGEVVLMSAAVLSIMFALLERPKMLWITGTVALAQLVATLVIFEHDSAAVVARADQPDLVDPIIMWAGSALRHSRFEWGIAVVAGGAAMVLAAALCDWRKASKA
jgi:hypothetical protein